MTRFEMSGTVVSVTSIEFWIETDATLLRIPLLEYHDKPKIGQKATVAVEVY